MPPIDRLPASRPTFLGVSLPSIKSVLVGALLVSASLVTLGGSTGLVPSLARLPGAEPLPPPPKRLSRRGVRRRPMPPSPPPPQLPDMGMLPAFENAAQRLQALRHAWGPTIAALREMQPFAAAYAEIDQMLAHPDRRLVPIGGGAGSAYTLQVGDGAPQWVVKPGDEDVRGPNHVGDTYTGPDAVGQRFRTAIPLLTAPQRELASRVVAQALGLDHVLLDAVVMSVDFAGSPHRVRAVPEPVKLCSVARFVPRAMHAGDFWRNQTLLKQAPFEEDTFAENMLFNWAIYDTDAHIYNTLVTVAQSPDLTVEAWAQLPPDQKAQHRLRLIRIDAGLAMPEHHQGLRNDLVGATQAHEPLREALRQRFVARLGDASLYQTAATIDALGLYPDGKSQAGAAYVTRMRALRSWLQDEPNMTLAQIHERFMQAESVNRDATHTD